VLDRVDNRCIIVVVRLITLTFDKELIMHKFSFTVDIVTDSPVGIDVDAVRGSLNAAVDGIGSIHAVHRQVKSDVLAEQGYKVWAKRVAGVSLAAPKPVKAPKAPKAVKAEVPATVEA
jgi:hypothetical protein